MTLTRFLNRRDSSFDTQDGPLTQRDLASRGFGSLDDRLAPVLPESVRLDDAMASEEPMDLSVIVPRPAGRHYRTES